MNSPSANDLSSVHSPIGTLFSTRCTEQDLNAFRLNSDQIRCYEEHGYVAGIPVLNDDQIEVLRNDLQRFFDPNHVGHQLWHEYHTNESLNPDTILFHALGAWRQTPAFHDLLWNPAFTVPASQLLEGSVRFWHDQLFCKPARHGGVVAWHQDYSYWTRTRPMAHLTCWIGLDDAWTDNGCLQYIPGSHRWDLLPITGLAGDLDAIEQALTQEQWSQMQSPVAIELKAGECAFHHPLLVHGSFANNTDYPRRAVVLNVVRDGVCSATDEPLLAGVDPIPAGQPLAGRFHPLLTQGGRAASRLRATARS